MKIKAGVRYLSAEEESRLYVVAATMSAAMYEAYQGDVFETMVRLGVLTGLRFGELCGLQWRDIQGTDIHVTRKLADDDISTPKHDKLRTISPTRAALSVLNARRATMELAGSVSPLGVLPQGRFSARALHRQGMDDHRDGARRHPVR